MNPPVSPIGAAEADPGITGRIRIVLIALVGFAFATVGSLFMLAVAIVTLFRARRLYSEVIARRMGQFALWLCGVRVVVHLPQPLPEGQTIYVSNHTSTLDVFLLIALGLPNTRFFMSGFLRKIPPVGLIGYLIGIFWTVPYRFPEKRRKIFQRAERVLRSTGESVYLSPEGSRIVTGEIGHFNRGSFHLATNLHVPIQPFFIHIPHAMNRGKSLVPSPGVVDIYFLPPVNTQDWRIEDLETNRKFVRDLFVDFHRRVQC